MRLFIGILACMILCVNHAISYPAIGFEYLEEWTSWKQHHQKSYNSYNEELHRHTAWLSNKKYVEEHNRNAEYHGFSLKLNHFGDMSDDEFTEQYSCHSLGDIAPNHTRSVQYQKPNKHNLPESVDWRTNGAVTRIKDQGKCGSCYAFSAVGALEGAYALAHDKLVDLSVQNIVDCSAPYGNRGCNGGTMINTYQYIIDNRGIDTDKSYPYSQKRGRCNFHKDTIGATQIGVVRIPRGKEDELQLAVATSGPVSVAVDGSSRAFRFYDRGVFNEPNCSSKKLTQAMLVIGYGKNNNRSHWIVKNSWGPNWGMKGYILMARGRSNQCGIASDASLPTL